MLANCIVINRAIIILMSSGSINISVYTTFIVLLFLVSEVLIVTANRPIRS